MKSKKTFLLPIVFFLLWEVVVWVAAARWTSGSILLLVGLISTAFGLVALVAYLAIARLLMRRAPGAAETPPNLSTPSDRADRSPVDTAPLSDLVREADRRLSQSLTLSRNAKSSLYDLPVYILAGAPGTGKTTAFLAADLSSELLAGQVHRETTVLPTSLCNLWYAAGSVFVEAGGRFFTEDIRQWHAFTEQLCGGRRSILHGLTPGKRQHAGVKGLIWFCDITLFLGATDPGRISNLARKVQERLLALAQSLGSSFPVYVVFTKADNLPHFEDFFRRLPENEDRQVFGVTLPASDLPERSEVYADAQTKRLLELFNALYLELADKRLPLLARETARDRKGGIYEFPREVKRIRDSLLQFLVESFRPNPLQPSPLLRGFYFSGMRHVPA
ncbi:MAG TPA: type VI secretion protein IcmF/TssM N-terminal domain-containing protein, partial [Bryobacteraceae bacterium]|nr:type VI secretion protein IcmF/TssM N-terminal domain-containing protein [Bryobacteraceae bacterium]